VQHGLDSRTFWHLAQTLSIHDDISMDIFCSSLDMKSTLDLGVAAGSSFAHITPIEGREILNHLIENSSFHTDHNEPPPPQEEYELSHKSLSIDKSQLSPFTSQDLSVELSPKP
jgi:hypothetical protein